MNLDLSNKNRKNLNICVKNANPVLSSQIDIKCHIAQEKQIVKRVNIIQNVKNKLYENEIIINYFNSSIDIIHTT